VEVRGQIERYGTYAHTTSELTFGARVAWRNSSRRIGRLYWGSLRVRDRRHVTTAAQVAAEAFAHLREATNSGRVRPTLTVFAPATPQPPPLPVVLRAGAALARRARHLPTCAWRSAASATRPRPSTGGTWAPRSVLVELNIAGLRSFDAAGVTIADHHTESRRFLTHLAREQPAGPTGSVGSVV
jgi:nitric oxide synthase oxygenase domain/subunit